MTNMSKLACKRSINLFIILIMMCSVIDRVGGLHAVDVSDPKNPTLAACFGDDGYVHDVECLDYHGPDTPYQGHEICFGYNEDSLTIMDVEDKNNIVMISRSEYDTAKYTHQVISSCHWRNKWMDEWVNAGSMLG